jgi:hypothetical protein
LAAASDLELMYAAKCIGNNFKFGIHAVYPVCVVRLRCHRMAADTAGASTVPPGTHLFGCCPQSVVHAAVAAATSRPVIYMPVMQYPSITH